MSEEHPLQVAWCMKIIPVDLLAANATKAMNPPWGQKGADEQTSTSSILNKLPSLSLAWGESCTNGYRRGYACCVSFIEQSFLKLFVILKQHGPKH
jgi:hypothetical protein